MSGDRHPAGDVRLVERLRSNEFPRLDSRIRFPSADGARAAGMLQACPRHLSGARRERPRR